MSSPVKVRVNEEAFGALQSEPKHGFYRALIANLFPSQEIKPMQSKQKPKKFPLWNKQTTGIVDHLWDVKKVAEQHVLYGTMVCVDEYFDKVFESVSLPEMRDELRQIESTVQRDVSVLLYLLVRAHHNQYDEQNALTELEQLGVFGNVEVYNTEFDRLANRVTEEYMTKKARVREYVKHLDPRINNAAHLSSRVDEGWSLIQVKNEALRVSRTPDMIGSVAPGAQQHPVNTPAPAPPSTPHQPIVHGAVFTPVPVPMQPVFTQPPPNPTPAPAPAPAGGDIEMQALNQRMEDLEIQWFNRGGGGGRRGGGRGARGGPAAPPGGRNRGGRGGGRSNNERAVCYVCGDWTHFARECPKRVQ